MVSIIIALYNEQDYFEECLTSVCNQEYKDIEIIIVDDGSTDGSVDICRRFAESDKRIKIIRLKHVGIAAVRNMGVASANGDFIMFVDSDDYVASNYVSRMLTVMNENPECDIVTAKFYNYKMDENGKYIATPCKSFYEKREMTGSEIIPLRFGNKKVLFVLLIIKLYRKRLFDGVRFPDGQVCEDSWVSLDIYQKCKKVICIDDHLYYYRNNVKSISHDKSLNWDEAQIKWLEREIFFFKNSVYESDLVVPSRIYISMLFKSLKKGIAKKDQRKECVSIAMDSIMKDKNITAFEKIKYRVYELSYLLCSRLAHWR